MDLRELEKRVGAPYFMVTATLPEERRRHFFTPAASEVYQLSFAAAQANLSTLHLPVLRWGNETDCQLPPTLARPSRVSGQRVSGGMNRGHGLQVDRGHGLHI